MKRILMLGRFQPPHNGHFHVLEGTAKRCDEVLIVVGSAQESFTPANPFTAGERMEMIQAALAERQIKNATIVPLADLHRHAEWTAYVASHVPPFEEVVTNNPLTKLLFGAAGYRVRTEGFYERRTCTGTRIRERLGRGESVEDAVPKSVLKVLRRIKAVQRLQLLNRTDLDAKRRKPS